MRFVSSRRNNAEAKNLGNDLRRIAGSIDAIVGELVGRQALRVKRAEAGFVAKKRAAAHGHAPRKKNFRRRVEPENGNAGSAEKFRAAGLRVGAATEGKDGAFFLFGGAAERGTELVGFHLSENGFAQAFEDLRDGESGSLFNAVIEIDKPPRELAGKQSANRGLAGTHEPGETQNGDAGLCPARKK